MDGMTPELPKQSCALCGGSWNVFLTRQPDGNFYCTSLSGCLVRRKVKEKVDAAYQAGRRDAAREILDHPGPDPSPASPAWWAGYQEAQQDAARIAREHGKGVLMGHFVIKAAKDRDLYLYWSTIVDNAIWVGDRTELADYLWHEYRCQHPNSTPNSGYSPDDRIARADRTGTSDLSCNDGGWDDPTLMVMEGSPTDGWYHIRRDRLADYAERLLADDERGAQALMECWKRFDDEDD